MRWFHVLSPLLASRVKNNSNNNLGFDTEDIDTLLKENSKVDMNMVIPVVIYPNADLDKQKILV